MGGTRFGRGQPSLQHVDSHRRRPYLHTTVFELVAPYKPAGVPEADIEVARRGGCTKVNIDTDLRLAMTAGIRKVFAENPQEFAPRKYLGPARVKELVRHKVKNVLCCAGHAFHFAAPSRARGV